MSAYQTDATINP